MEDLELSEKEREAYAAQLFADPPRFCREVLPGWFPKKMPWVHRGVLALILGNPDFLLNFGAEHWKAEDAAWTVDDLRKIEKHFTYKPEPNGSVEIRLFDITWDGDIPVDIQMFLSEKMIQVIPRGFSKTTLMNAAVLYMILYKLKQFLVYISETALHAESQLGNVKSELMNNELIHAIWGDISATRKDEEKWREDEIETKTGVHVVCRGRGGQVRGLNRKGKRPDLLLLDDVEDKESVSTPEQRKKVLEWVKGDVEPARAEMAEDFRIFFLGTMLHKEAMLPTLMLDPEYISVVFGAIDPDGDMLWEAMMSREKLAKRKRSFVRTGTLHIFYMELMSQLRTPEHSKFKPEFIRYAPTRDMKQFVARSLAIDPALSEGVKASACTLSVVGITEAGVLHVLACEGRKGMTPKEQVDAYFRLSLEYDCTHHGVESIAYQRALIHLLQAEMFKRGKEIGSKAYFEITPISHGRVDKAERILGVLQPRYAAGYITHQRVFPELEEALLDWPNGSMDYPDAVAMAVSLLDPFASLGGTEDHETEEDSEDLEDLLEGDFRHAP